MDDKPSNGYSAYAGRWVARLWGRIVGQGGTPDQALQAAKAARPKEKPQVSYVPTPGELSFSPLLAQVAEAVPARQQVYLVGGAVRDAILQTPSYDLDFTVKKDALKLARRVANKLEGAYYRLDEERETGRVVLNLVDAGRVLLDFSTMRGLDLESDLRGRDFTINAMAVNVHEPQQLLDPLDGLNGLFKKQLRLCAPNAIVDDPLRILRAVRFSAKLNLKMLPETRKLIRENVPLLKKPSSERVRDELFKILDTIQPATSMRALEMLGALEYVLPELLPLKDLEQSAPHVSDVWTHTLHTVHQLEGLLALLSVDYQVDNESGGDLFSGMISLRLGRYRQQFSQHINTALSIERPYRPLLFLAALYHDSGKPETRTEEEGRFRFFGHENSSAALALKRGHKLHLSRAELQRLKTIIKHHMRPMLLANEPKLPSRRAIYRFFRDTGEAGISIALLSLADVLAAYDQTLSQEVLSRHLDVIRLLLDAYWERPLEIVSPPALLEGREIIKTYKLKPGPLVGKLLEAVREAQAAGEVQTKGDALQLIERILVEDKK
jgi:tRNA nucleotidyltransferase/poly(A) polymerase